MATVPLSDILYQYGAAFRDDYSNIDGKTVQCDMDTFAKYVKDRHLELNEDEARDIRRELALCPKGEGHWTDHCFSDCRED